MYWMEPITSFAFLAFFATLRERSCHAKLVRGQKVMLDKDLAQLYGVETRVLNQVVRRNAERFPADFMFKLTRPEVSRISQFVISSDLKFSKNVYAFTQLSSQRSKQRPANHCYPFALLFIRFRQYLKICLSLFLQGRPARDILQREGSKRERILDMV